MKTKTWTVITNTGKQADLQSGLEKKAVQKPPYISAKEFVHWLAPDSQVDDDSLRSLYSSSKTSPAGAQTSPSALRNEPQSSSSLDGSLRGWATSLTASTTGMGLFAFLA